MKVMKENINGSRKHAQMNVTGEMALGMTA
jgi:hypothetical protein